MRCFQFLACATLAVFVQGAKLGNHHGNVEKPSQLYGPPQETAQAALAEPNQPDQKVPEEASIYQTLPEINQDNWGREKFYKFGYSSQGGKREESSDYQGNVVGSYIQIGVDGEPFEVRYTAGSERGFVIENIDEVRRRTTPIVEEVGAPSAAGTVDVAYTNDGHASQPQQFVQPAQQTHTSQIQRNSFQGMNTKQQSNSILLQYNNENQQPQTGPEEGPAEEPFMEFDFGYSNALGSHNSNGDNSGNVRGEYSYPTADGQTIKVQYKVNPTSGFVIENEAELKKTLEGISKTIGEQPQQQQQKQQQPPVSYQTPVQPISNTQHQQQVPQTGTYQSQLGYSNKNQQPQPGPEEGPAEEPFMEFDFGYSNLLGSHNSNGDNSGNVRGEYSYPTADGQTIKVQYKVNPTSGFVIENEAELKETLEGISKTIGEQQQQQHQRQQQQQQQTPVSYQTPVQSISNTQHQQQISQIVPITTTATRPQLGYSNDNQQTQPQQKALGEEYAAYNFGYSYDLNSRKETADNSGNVNGEYSYVDANGENVRVQYKAGPQIGFVIENGEEPQGSPVQAQNGFAYQSQINAAGQQALDYPELPKEDHSGHQQLAQGKKQNEEEIKYKPYSFNYQGDESSRFEESDASGAVRGQYNYINAEGNTILVQYSASPDTGFVIENEQELSQALEKATKDGAQAAAAARTEQQRKQAEQKQEVQRGLSGFNQFAKDRQHSQPAFHTPSSKYSQQTQVGQVKGASYQRPHQPQAHTYAQASAPTLSVTSLLGEEPTRRRIVVRKRRPQAQTGHSTSSKANHATQQTNYAQTAKEPDYEYEDDSEQGPNAAYSFSYQTKGQSQIENTDDQGERVGSYSYITPEGTEVEVRYRAGRNGFEILN
ncbi:uncharacterized protein LOC131889922 [Tigriopus californicus]|uniref:uncharacterized protein LOC131889922 n=1 Tax=Tigriopus californicus TaxID=6832 RepID=UPI0027DA8603|nr:uncharacterized protein LOC131889922 [Tigriopus californicus]